jgi:hypothetical protein
MSKISRKISAAIAAIATAFVPLTAVSITAADAAENKYSFASCLQEKGVGHVVLMMDESGSVYGTEDSPATDPNNRRIAGAQILLDRLQAVSDTYDKPVNVQLAGFGDNFKPRPDKNWVELKPNTETSLKTLTDATNIWADKSKLGNSRETDLVSAISGARDAFLTAPAESCKLFVFFKDGNDFHVFNPKVGKHSPVAGYDDINKLLDAGKIDAANKAAVKEICRDGGLADALRLDKNLYSVGVGIKSGGKELEGFKKFKAVIEGKPTPGCKGGNQPANGVYLDANNIDELPGKFATILDPNAPEQTMQGNFELDLKHALSGIRIISAGVNSKSYTVQPPKGCKSPDLVFKAGEDKREETIGGSVLATAKWMGDSKHLETFSLVLKHSNMADDSCWVGKWKFIPGDGAVSNLYFEADLQALPVFTSASPYVVPGDETGSDYTIRLSRPSEQGANEIPAADIDKEMALTLEGFVRSAETKQIEPAFESFTLSGDDLDEGRTLKAPASVTMGGYELVLRLTVKVAGFNHQLMPITTQTVVQVRSAKQVPAIVGVTDFGALKGTDRAKGTIKIQGSPEEDYTLNFADAKSLVAATSFPDGVKYEFAFTGEDKKSAVIPKGQTVSIPVWIKAVPTDKKLNGEVRAHQPIGGKLSIAMTAASEKTPVVISGEFKGDQQASANSLFRTIILILFVLLGLLINLLVIKLVANAFNKLPKKFSIQYLFVDVQFTKDVFVNMPAIRAAAEQVGNWQFANNGTSRKLLDLGGRKVRVTGGGFKLSQVGAARLDIGTDIGMSSNNPHAAELPLALTNSWAFHTNPASLRDVKQGSTGYGTVLLVRRPEDLAPIDNLINDFERECGTALRSLLEQIKIPENQYYQGDNNTFGGNTNTGTYSSNQPNQSSGGSSSGNIWE